MTGPSSLSQVNLLSLVSQVNLLGGGLGLDGFGCRRRLGYLLLNFLHPLLLTSR